MKTISEYLKESYLVEFNQDLQPQVIVIMGNPAAGKTTFVLGDKKKHIPPQLPLLLKKPGFQARMLDSDNNLRVEQLNSCNKLAMDIIMSCCGDNTVQKFNTFMAEMQQAMNEEADKAGSPHVDLSGIDYRFCSDWIERYNTANEGEKDKVVSSFQSEFYKKYFRTIFASDFSRRAIGKAQYKKDFQAKLRGIRDIDGVEFVSPTDVAIAITGDEVEKFDAIGEVAKEMGAVMVVIYLDCSIERSIRNDLSRDRSVGETTIRGKAEAIRSTWNTLVKSFKDHGIFRMYHMVEGPKSTVDSVNYILNQEYVNPYMK